MSDRQAVFFDEYHLDVKVCMAWLPYCVSAGHGAWRVLNLGYFGRLPKHFTSITAQRLDRLG